MQLACLLRADSATYCFAQESKTTDNREDRLRLTKPAPTQQMPFASGCMSVKMQNRLHSTMSACNR